MSENNKHTLNMESWLIAIRPKTLFAALSPLILGNSLAFAHESFSFFIAITSVICALLLQIVVNLSNDYSDFIRGVDSPARLGPARACQSGLLTPKQVKIGVYISSSLAVLTGLILVSSGGWPIFFCGLLSLICAICYSSGPRPLADFALGEVTVFIFFGLVAVTGSYYLQTQQISLQSIVMACSIGLLNSAIMFVNNTRDIVTDNNAGKVTLAVKLGKEMCIPVYRSLLYAAIAITVTAFLLGVLPGWPVFLSGLCFIYARKLAEKFESAKGIEFNDILNKTALITFIFSLLFSAGYFLDIHLQV
ncbi:1,4-dihydroxy-2-naphthoate polyprenyltransferase [Parashewanella spongiae]|nr:1,4-dihydroxy-2-naphthoate polyprenyltransferase [Parashewanella spongiae]